MKNVVRYLLLLAMLICLTSVATSKENKSSQHTKNKYINNIGFIKKPSRALKNKFPMCDVFLKIKWIDKTKKIGYVEYDTHMNGNNSGRMTALIYINKYYPHFDYDVYQYKRLNKLNSLFSFIRNGKIVGKDVILQIYNNGKTITFWPTIPITPSDATIADNTLNICAVYPNKKMAWIVETKKVGKIYSREEIISRYNSVKKHSTSIPIDYFKDCNIIDLNHDNKEDYYNNGFVYSIDNKYYENSRKGYFDKGKQYYILEFPPSRNKCKTHPGFTYIVTNGSSYFLGSQCNLTKLISDK